MGRLCERPGCSEVAAVAYGMRTEDLVFWLDALSDSTSPASGVLCQRHGDSMVVPRGWTLDDHRDPDLHLFRPPNPKLASTVRRRRRTVGVSDDSQQLALGGLVLPDENELVENAEGVAAEQVSETESESDIDIDTVEGSELASDAPWAPNFDAADDLDGLLSARSPLLSRAFRGTDRRA